MTLALNFDMPGNTQTKPSVKLGVSLQGKIKKIPTLLTNLQLCSNNLHYHPTVRVNFKICRDFTGLKDRLSGEFYDN